MQLTHFVKRDPQFVFSKLSEAGQFATVHPLIFKMEEIEKGKYQVYEKLKFLFIPVTITYTTTIVANAKNQEVIMDALVKRKTRIKIYFSLTPVTDGTKIEESVEFHSPLPIKRMFLKLMRKQHLKLFTNIEKGEK